MNASPRAAPPPPRIGVTIGTIVAVRTAINAAYRAPIPFLGAVAASYGASTANIGWLSVAFSVALFIAPLAGLIEAKIGRRAAVLSAMGLFVASCFATPFAPTLGAAGALFVALSVAKALFEPHAMAFISEQVPFERRGTAIGFVELSWALAFIIGSPVFGYFVEFGRWSTAFVLAGIVAALSTVALFRFTPFLSSRPLGDAVSSLSRKGLRAVFGNRLALKMLFYSALISMPAQITTLIYGPWFTQQFALTPARLGVASTVIGVADLLAELATVVLVDRIGKRRSLVGSTIAYAASLIFFWLAAGDFTGALVGLFLIFFTFEFALVTSLAVQTEIVPSARATMAGFVTSAHGIARISGSLIALPPFLGGQLAWPMGFGALLIAVATGVAWKLRVTHKSGAALANAG